MGDILERLRKDGLSLDGDVEDPLLEEAACEIERLREAWVDGKMREDRDVLLVERDALAARLAEAQEELAQWRATGESVTRNEHDLSARLAEVERLLQEVYDGRQSLMSVGLVYRIGHTLNHRPADSASAEAGAGDR